MCRDLHLFCAQQSTEACRRFLDPCSLSLTSKTCLPPHPHRTIREPSEMTMQPCATQEKKWSCLLIGIVQLVSHPHAHPITQSQPPQTSQKEPINQPSIAIIHPLPVQIGRFLACMSVTRLLAQAALVFRP